VWHTPVLLERVVEWLRIRPGGMYVDATTGTAGHTLEIARRLTTGRVVGLDRDAEALEIARERLREVESRVMLVNANFSGIGDVLKRLGIPAVDGIVADLGVSTLQLDTPSRGFSFRYGGPLDMRMNSSAQFSAAEIVNQWPEKVLADLIYRFGEERNSRRIARAIVRARPIRDTGHLATVVEGAQNLRGRRKLHPATKTFLALRIAVNRELEELGQFLDRAPATLAANGRWVFLTYHSLEDRMVKQAFRRYERERLMKVLTKHVERPSQDEIETNPRARSAMLRAAEKLPPRFGGEEDPVAR
jgi:16S rRNA (cytosine1402-N4)-methyltransferase